MREWDDYRACCRSMAAHDRAATFCPKCGQPLFRCAAPGCGALVTPLGHCPACIDLRLSLEKGAFLTARSGECLAVPFVLANGAAARPLAIRRVLRDGPNLPQADVALPWEQLEAGRARALAVEAGPFPHGGLYGLRLTVVVSAALHEIEETFAFSGETAIDVGGPPPGGPKVDLGGATFGTGGGVYVVQEGVTAARRSLSDALSERTEVRLERAERFEIQQGCRGYDRHGVRVPRNVPFVFANFPDADRPPDGPLMQRPVVRCGRNGRAEGGAPHVEANDLCLRVYCATPGELDREASGAISRRACDLALANDRLYVRAIGRQGIALNGDLVAPGDARVAGHGDVLEVPAGRGKALRLAIAFRVSAGLVTQIRVEKAS